MDRIGHTPGPWNVESTRPVSYDECGNYLSGYVIEQEYINVAEVCGGINPMEAQANAHLIAAAPELLEACQGILRVAIVLDDVAKHNMPHLYDTNKIKELFEAINDAVNKAEQA